MCESVCFVLLLYHIKLCLSTKLGGGVHLKGIFELTLIIQ